MRINKLFICLIIVVWVLCGCSKNTQLKVDMYYGESSKWIVIAYPNNTFLFMYKGKISELKDSGSSIISFAYGTSLGSVSESQSIKDTTIFTQKYTIDYIRDLDVKNTFDVNKYINVQIGYGKIVDNVDLAAYNQINNNR